MLLFVVIITAHGLITSYIMRKRKIYLDDSKNNADILLANFFDIQKFAKFESRNNLSVRIDIEI